LGGLRRGCHTGRPSRASAHRSGATAIATIVPVEDKDALGLAIGALDAGKLVVIPTDTVYGLAARLDRPAAIGGIFEVKQRPRSKPVAVLVDDLTTAFRVGVFSDEARRRARESWPGALTLVVPCVTPLPELGGHGTTVGLRIPAHEWTLSLLRACGPLATTSANPSGSPTGAAIEDVIGDLGEGVDLYVDGGRLESLPSTVISLVGEPEVLRQRLE
jgi:L-threonylcarbamoyladenylate synthase